MIEIIEQSGGIVLKLTDKAEFIDKYGEENPNPDVCELLDDSRYLGNGWDDGTDRCCFALTGSPIILFDGELDEETNLFRDAEGVYWFPGYETENPFQTLLQTGSVRFIKA